ncbi:MAG: sodium:proton antiporter [Proteobacteria bacterium]|nr:MAG: sodium:proton antiporter [Pseudomonadota bacterium]
MPLDISWFLFLGLLLLSAAVLRTYLKPLPVTSSLTYFIVGMAVGPYGLKLITIDALEHVKWLEVVTEVAVVVSLFTAGLKVHIRSTAHLWSSPTRLATIGVAISVFLFALFTHYVFALSWGLAILLGAILSPTDPVLASDVQVEEVHDNDKVRFTLTGEACLNDGTAFPFVMLGLGLLGLHDLGEGGLNWIFVDVIWSSVVGLGVGYGLGYLVGKLVLYIRNSKVEEIQADEFLALGLIATSYGVALAFHSYGFLAVFAAGFALRSFDKKKEAAVKEEGKEVSYDPDAVLSFNEQLERILEIVVVVLFGSLFQLSYFNWASVGGALVLIFIIRPISAYFSIGIGTDFNRLQKTYIAWFGVRGVGSLYYFFYATSHGLDLTTAQLVLGITYVSILLSMILHGFSVTPLMSFYRKRV